MVCERAAFTYTAAAATPPNYAQRYEIRWHDGRVETGARESRSLIWENLHAYLRYVRGLADRPLNRLVDCRPFVHLNGLMYVAAGRITTIPRAALTLTADGFVAIRALDKIAERFRADGSFRVSRACHGQCPAVVPGLTNCRLSVWSSSAWRQHGRGVCRRIPPENNV